MWTVSGSLLPDFVGLWSSPTHPATLRCAKAELCKLRSQKCNFLLSSSKVA